MLDALWLSFAVIFVAELGDKSQLIALSFSLRYRALPILLGITGATGLVHALSVALGGAMGSALSSPTVSVLSALAFFGFAVWTVRGDRLDDDEAAQARRGRGSAVVTVAIAFFLAELGDKTMLATVTLATREDLLGTWIGSTLGMVAADALVIGIGRAFGHRLPERTVRIGAAALFVAFGGWLLAEAWAGR